MEKVDGLAHDGGLTEHLWDGNADSECRAHDVGFGVDVGGKLM